MTDWDQIFGAAFGHLFYSTYQVSCLWVLPAHHKLIKRKQWWLMTNRPHPLSPINMALKILVKTRPYSMHTKFGEILSDGLWALHVQHENEIKLTKSLQFYTLAELLWLSVLHGVIGVTHANTALLGARWEWEQQQEVLKGGATNVSLQEVKISKTISSHKVICCT